jgi:hypothetical protein
MAEVMEPLWRVPAYEQDLRFHLGPDWRQQIPTSPAIQVGGQWHGVQSKGRCCACCAALAGALANCMFVAIGSGCCSSQSQTPIPPLPAPRPQAYSARLRRLAAEQPLLLLAHAFTQHLAGLSGGRIIKRLARKYMKLPDDKGGLWHGSTQPSPAVLSCPAQVLKLRRFCLPPCLLFAWSRHRHL